MSDERMGRLGRLVLRLWRMRVVSALLLFLVTLCLTDPVGHYRRPGLYASLGLLIGFGFLVLSLLIFLQRLLTATPPASLRPALEHSEQYAVLIALNLILLNLLAPVAEILSLLPTSPLIRGVLFGISRLSGRLLVTLFVGGIGLLVLLVFVRILDRVVLPAPAARRVARGIHRLAVGAIAVYAGYGIVLAYNGSLDTGAATEHRAEVVQMRGWPPMLQWTDIRGWEPGQPLTRIWVFRARDGAATTRMTPGQPVLVQIRPGFLGIPWVDTMRPDAFRQAEAILREAPTAANVRREVIRKLLQQSRWAEALAQTETHHQQYPHDRAGLADIAQVFRAANRPAEASAIEDLGRRPIRSGPVAASVPGPQLDEHVAPLPGPGLDPAMCPGRPSNGQVRGG